MAIEITIKSNLSEELQNIREQVIDQINSTNHPVLISAAASVLALVAYRIHTEGKKASGSQIGTYDNAYLKRRQGPKYNRTADPTMVFSLTRQMENDFTVIAEDNVVGLGFKNPTNLDKATWLEASHPGTYVLSSQEEQVVVDAVNDYIDALFI